jgi:FtsZ-binding cell division protein ZapB
MSDYPFHYDTLIDHIIDLKREIAYLKKENVELTNELYAVQNRIDIIELKGEQNGTI